MASPRSLPLQNNSVIERLNNLLAMAKEAEAEVEDLRIENGKLTTEIGERDIKIDSLNRVIGALSRIHSRFQNQIDELQDENRYLRACLRKKLIILAVWKS
jgi:chromosome segregation ATPase